MQGTSTSPSWIRVCHGGSDKGASNLLGSIERNMAWVVWFRSVEHREGPGILRHEEDRAAIMAHR